MQLVFILITLAIISLCHGQVTDRKTGALVDHIWMEVGFTFMDDQAWTTITTRTSQFVGDIVAFVSLPNIDGETSNDGYPAAVKMREAPSQNPDGSVTFAMKLVQPNDSFCENYKPAGYISPKLQVSWVVVEEGAYQMNNGQQLLMSSGNITRLDDSTSAANFNGNIIRYMYPTGCTTDGAIATDNCRMDDPQRSTIAQILTNNNVKEAGKDLFLTVRAKNVGATLVQFILVPHDAANFPTYYQLHTPEKLAYWVFDAGVSILCEEKLVIETRKFTGVTNDKQPINFEYTYDYNPGVYGIIGSVNSLGDSTALRVFDRTTTGSSIITQEDKCDDAETIHTTAETVYALIVGESVGITSDQTCNVQFNAADDTFLPTSAPSAQPTLKPSPGPTSLPTLSPTAKPTTSPTTKPTSSPTSAPSLSPTSKPTTTPTLSPTATPTVRETAAPTGSCSESVFPVRMTMRTP